MTQGPPPGEGAPDPSEEPHPTPPPGSMPPPDGGWSPPGGPGRPSHGPPPYGQPVYGVPGPPGPPVLADYGARLGGWLIDFAILAVVALIVIIPLHQVHAEHVVVRGMHTLRYRLRPIGVLINAVTVIVYGGLFCGSPRGQTIGMMVTRTRAVSADSGAAIGYPRAFGRAAFEYLMVVALIVPWVIDMLFPLWDPQKQTLHDRWPGRSSWPPDGAAGRRRLAPLDQAHSSDSMAAISARRGTWRPPSKVAVTNTSRIVTASSGATKRAPSASTLALLWFRARRAVVSSWQSAARAPWTLLAAMASPWPLPPRTTPRSA